MLTIGHRGAAGHEPENTLRSFRRAIEIGVDMIELDVHVCKTGELIVIHDETLERTTNGKGRVDDTTLDELQTLTADKGERIPTLEEVLTQIEPAMPVNIELKGKGTGQPATHLIAKIVKMGPRREDSLLVSSFNKKELRAFRKENTTCRVGFVTLFPLVSLSSIIDVKGYSMHAWFHGITPGFIRRVHEAGLKLFAWTVNQPTDIQNMISKGVDGIFSDFPDRVLQYSKTQLRRTRPI